MGGFSDAESALGRHLLAVQAPPAGRYLVGLAVMLLGVVRASSSVGTLLAEIKKRNLAEIKQRDKEKKRNLWK